RLGRVVLALPAILADAAQLFGQRRVVGDHHAAVAERAEVLGRVEAKAATHPQAARRPAALGRAMGLGPILDYWQAVARGDLEDGPHVGHATIEVHRHDRLRAPGDRRLQRRWVEVKAALVHLDEDRPRAGLEDGDGAWYTGVGHGDDFI